MRIFLAMLAITLVISMLTIAVVSLTLAYPNYFLGKGGEHSVYADPWSWGKPPSKAWLHCYYSGSHDCTHIR